MTSGSIEPTVAEVSRWISAKPVWVVVSNYDATENSKQLDPKGNPLPRRTAFWVHGMLKDGRRIEYGPFYTPVSPVIGDKRLNLETNRFEVVNFRFNKQAPIYRAKPDYQRVQVIGPLEGEPTIPGYRTVRIAP